MEGDEEADERREEQEQEENHRQEQDDQRDNGGKQTGDGRRGGRAPTFALRPKRGPTSGLVLEVKSATLGATWSSVRMQGLPWALATRFRSGRVA